MTQIRRECWDRRHQHHTTRDVGLRNWWSVTCSLTLYPQYRIPFILYIISIIQGVPKHWAHFDFCNFLGFCSTYRGTSDLYSTALEICYMIATRILKIDFEIDEIIEVKVGTRHLEIDILLLHRVKKTIWCYRYQLWPQLSQLFLNQFSKFLWL